ncbi:MAG: hypothetical protein JWN70_4483 [Planctomycetaceae bacterium]|nr:hypothetical protein [Planctomycetaceae bacterium]
MERNYPQSRPVACNAWLAAHRPTAESAVRTALELAFG